MTDLTYCIPDPPTRPFAKGDQVETINRNGEPMGRQQVTKADDRIVRTDCGRQWTQDGDWWNGKRAYPFPTIRLTST